MTETNQHGGARDGAGRKKGSNVAPDRVLIGRDDRAAATAQYLREQKLSLSEPGSAEPPVDGEPCWFWVRGEPVAWGHWSGNGFITSAASWPERPPRREPQ